MRRLRFILVGLTLMTIANLALNAGQHQDYVKPKLDPLDAMLRAFVHAVGELDDQKLERLFLPPDDTPAGINRMTHIQEMQEDWKEMREKGEKISVSFTNTKKIFRTTMVSGNSNTMMHVIPIEFEVTLTEDGWKIIRMDYLKNKEITE